MTLRSHGKPQMRVVAAPEEPPQTAIPVSRRRPWWQKLLDWWNGTPELPRAPQAIVAPPPAPAPLKIGHDVLVMAGAYLCGTCGYQIGFEPLDSDAALAKTRNAVGACSNARCRLVNVRLRVPVAVINCELVP